MEKKKLLLLCLLLVVVIAAAAFGYKALSEAYEPENTLSRAGGGGAGAEDLEGSENPESSEGQADAEPVLAPDFTVYDKDGKQVSLSDYLGRPVIVNFWASWCGPCKMEMPHFQEAYDQYGDDVEFLMVNVTDGSQETAASAEAFIEKEGYTFPVYFDSDLNASATYGIYSIPATLAVDEEGYVITGYVGTLSEELVAAFMSLLLGE